jgi:hypothetical protein
MDNYGAAINVGNRISVGGLLLLLGIGALCILLEFYLARREKWWLGLLVPLATFLWTVWQSVRLWSMLPTELQTNVGPWYLLTILAKQDLLLTMFLLAVYVACRAYRKQKIRRTRETERMNLDELS